MEKQTKNLGHVTAYGYAKSQGYEGTEAEYAELMASYATVAERAEAAADEAAESAQEVKDVIPEVTSADNGKVMMVENGEWGAGEVDVLPPVTTQDNGKVLGVVAGQWAKTEPEDGLPSVTSSDNGKVLSVVEGEWAPAEPTGGSGLPEVTSEDNGDLLSVVDGAWAKSEPGYRAEMVDGLVIVPEQTGNPFEDNGAYIYEAQLGGTAAANAIIDWVVNGKKPDTLPATFNGVDYVLPTTEIESGAYRTQQFWCGEVSNGNPVFTTFPFCIRFSVSDGAFSSLIVYVPTADSFTIKIAEEVHTAIPTEDFKLAVNNSYTQPMVTQETFWAAQSITTEAVSGKSYAAADGPTFDYSSPVPEKLNVVFDGTAYELPKIPMLIAYGEETDQYDPDFTTYPLFLLVVDNGSYANLQLLTPQAGTYTLSATYTEATTAPTEKFKEAVHGIVSTGAWFEVRTSDTIDSQTTEPTLECTPEDIWSAISRGQNLYFKAEVAVNGGTGSVVADCPLIVYEFENTGHFYVGGTLIALGESSIAFVGVTIDEEYGAGCTYREVTFS